ncbi:MAG: hypothetical protein RBS39_11210 [Phycisphaerales bacterium]|jgi:hypothetical protein|nr:hypothetical protein [Phycisphaerales bacterium]
MKRRGAILLELLIALAMLAAAGLAIAGAIERGVATSERGAERARALDLARSAMAVIDAGVASAEVVTGDVEGGSILAMPVWGEEEGLGINDAFDRAGTTPVRWRLDVETSDAGRGLTLVTIGAIDLRRGEDAAPEATLTQVVAAEQAAARGADGAAGVTP